jgi:hypothetical protein
MYDCLCLCVRVRIFVAYVTRVGGDYLYLRVEQARERHKRTVGHDGVAAARAVCGHIAQRERRLLLKHLTHAPVAVRVSSCPVCARAVRLCARGRRAGTTTDRVAAGEEVDEQGCGCQCLGTEIACARRQV